MRCKKQPLIHTTILASVFLALFADAKTLNLIVTAAYPSFSGVFMTAMYAVIVIGLFFIGLFLQNRSIITLKRCHLEICLLCILWYMITSVFVAPPSVNVQFFGIFMLAAFLVPGIIRIDVRTFLIALVVLPSLGVLYLDQIFYVEILETGVVSMGTCYALLTPVLASFTYLRFYYKKESLKMKIFMLFFVAVNLYYLVEMAMFGSRGPILCALLLITCFFIIQIDDNKKITIRKGRITTIVIGLVILISSFKAILQALQNFLATFDISLSVIDKMLRLENEGDMTNGRESLSAMAWNGFLESPLFGNGVSQFHKNTGGGYPHNFILQMLYDGGIILTSGIMLPITRLLKHKLKTVSENEFVCLLFLFFASVPGALFSGDLWNAGTLWMFFGFVLAKDSVFENNAT